MRGGAHLKKAQGFVTLLWNHQVLTGLVLLIFTPPFFPMVVYFSPLLMSTALCVVALVSVGSQMEKIKAEGGPRQLESHLGRDRGVSTWAPHNHSRAPGNESVGRHYGSRGGESNHRSLHAGSGINIHIVPAPSSWTGGGQETAPTATARVTLQLPVENHPHTPAAAQSEEDWLDAWLKEYESRPGWSENEDQQLFRTPATIPASTTASPAPAPATIPTPTPAREADGPSIAPLKPLKPEIRVENRPTALAAASIPGAPVAAAPVAALVSVSVMNRQGASQSLPPPPTTSTSRSPSEEVVVSVKVSNSNQPHISTLAPIRTGREKRDHARQVGRIGKTPQEILLQAVPTTKTKTTSVDVATERVSDVQALQSIEKLLHMEMAGSAMTPPTSRTCNTATRETMSPGLTSVVASGKGIAVEATEKNRSKNAAVGAPLPAAPAAAPADHHIAGETPLLRHLKTSRSEKQSQNSSAYSPLPLRSSRGLMSEKVHPPPQFCPRLLESLQPLPPKGLSPRPLPNLSTVPLGNPVEKIPQWVYDGIPKDRAEKQAMKAETPEEKHVRAFEQAVKVLSSSRRRRTHAHRPPPIQVTDSQGRQSTPSTPSLPPAAEKESSQPIIAELAPVRISEDKAAERADHPRHDLSHGNSAQDSTERAPATFPTHRASTAFSPHRSPSSAAFPDGTTAAAVSPRVSSSPLPSPHVPAAAAASPPKASTVSAQLPSRASSPQRASIPASPRPAAPTAASPHRSSRASSPRTAPIAASTRRASRASSPSIGTSPWPASVASSPHKSASSAAAASPHRASVPSSPSIPPPRRRRHSSKHINIDRRIIEGSPTYYDDTPLPATPAEKENSEEYVPIEKEVMNTEAKELLIPDSNSLSPGDPILEAESPALHWGRSCSFRRSSQSRRRLEPRRVVTSQDAADDMFRLNKSSSMRNGHSVNFVDSSTTDDERESVTRRASRRSMGRTIKPLVWRSRSVQAHEGSD